MRWQCCWAVKLEISDSLPKLDEFWTDVSLLTLADAAKTLKLKDGAVKSDAHESDTHALTFDWFFTGGNYQAAAEAVAEPALHDMVEAQGRIISVSPPISLERKA
jgi:hypothetical protein